MWRGWACQKAGLGWDGAIQVMATRGIVADRTRDDGPHAPTERRPWLWVKVVEDAGVQDRG